jgi:hypothetical protein
MTSRAAAEKIDARPWQGPTRRYDIIKEGVVAIVIVSIFVALLAAIFSSPDSKPITFKEWASASPEAFAATAVQELAGTSGSATYGPPYNSASDGLNVGPLYLQKWAGVGHPLDSANSFVIDPLRTMTQSPDVTAALAEWDKATADQQLAWATAYDTALADATAEDGSIDMTAVAAGDYGPVPGLSAGLLAMATSGALDGVLKSGETFFATDTTNQLMFLGDGTYLEDAAVANHLGGGQWGMMNETGPFPGQAWLWLYSFWYQIPPFSDEEQQPFGANADAYIWVIMGLLSLALMLLPFIPGLRSIPRWIPIHRLIWREYYRNVARESPTIT